MERTESIVIQVAPNYENDKIKEMEAFGWSLQNRQEMHEEGEAYGRPSFVGDAYIIKTTVHKYVKLHFVRSTSLANLEAIKALEREYNSLPAPDFPRRPTIWTFATWPGIWWYFKRYKPKQALAEAQLPDFVRKRQALLGKAADLLIKPPEVAISMQNQNKQFQETEGKAIDEKTAQLKIRFSCKNCGCKYIVDSKYSGKKGKCKKCGSDIQVPHY